MNNSSNVSFNGAFLIKYPKTIPNLREGLEKNIGNHGKVIFDNFNGNKQSVLYVLRNSRDCDVAKFIQKNPLKFEYMPELDTKALQEQGMGLNAVISYIENGKSKVIKKTKELMEFISANREETNVVKSENRTKFYKKVIDKLGLDVKGNPGKNNRGVYSVQDKVNDGLLSISPKSKLGFSYVYVKPSNSYEPIRRYAVNEQGDVVATFQTPGEINKFKELFKQSAQNFLNSKSKS